MFKFRLEKALHFLSLKETVKRMEVAVALQRVQLIKRRVEQLERSILELLKKGSENPSPNWMLYQTSQVARDNEELYQLEKQLDEETALLETKKKELSSILMKKKGLESLRAKKFHEHKVEQNRKQQNELDEVFRISHSADKA